MIYSNIQSKIFFILPSFRRGGVERVTLNIINSLDHKRFEIHLLICVGVDNEYISFLNKNVNVVQLKRKDVKHALPKIFQLINSENPDIVFSSFDHISLPILIYKCLFFRRFKTVIRLNTLPSNGLETRRVALIYSRLFKYFLRSANEIISQSREMSEDISKYYNIKKSRISTIHNLVDKKHIQAAAALCSDIEFDPDYYNLIAIGSLSEVKGFDLLIKAIELLRQKGHTNYRLYIIGDNRDPRVDYRSILQGLISAYGLDNIIYLVGFKKNPFAILNKADAFVLSSRKEGFPNVVLEALVLGKPCLVTNCVDFDGVITPENGVIVEKNSEYTIAEGLLKLRNVQGDTYESVNFNYNDWFSKIVSK